MSPQKTRLRIENEILERQGRKYSEEEQANHLMNLLLENYSLRSAAVLMLEPSGRGVSVFAHRGLSGGFIKEMYSRPLLPVVEAALSGEVAVSAGDPRAADPSFRLEHSCKSLYAAPCRLQEETLGVFLADSESPDLLSAEVREEFRAYAALVALYLAMRTLKGKISRVPDVDSVTGLFTFKYFHEVLHREITRGRKFRHPVSLLFIKVCHLREMNEIYGHVAADRALAEATERIKAAFREVDYLARSGGNVHVVMPQLDKADAAKAAAALAQAMEVSPIGKGEVFLKLAMGVATYPQDGDTERVLIPHVESMVHESMRKGGNAVSVYKD